MRRDEDVQPIDEVDDVTNHGRFVYGLVEEYKSEVSSIG